MKTMHVIEFEPFHCRMFCGCEDRAEQICTLLDNMFPAYGPYHYKTLTWNDVADLPFRPKDEETRAMILATLLETVRQHALDS